MPQTKVVFYREKEGTVPLLEWFETLLPKVQDKCRIKIERLKELAYELRRPEADYLRDGIYELRVRFQRVNYRMLYFFQSNIAAILSHGITKEATIPAKEIDRAIENKNRFLANPQNHTFEESQ
jgi:phage-related protein